VKVNRRTAPLLVSVLPLPSSWWAPTASRVQSALNATEMPKLSPVSSAPTSTFLPPV
jgi:hypothetical protein